MIHVFCVVFIVRTKITMAIELDFPRVLKIVSRAKSIPEALLPEFPAVSSPLAPEEESLPSLLHDAVSSGSLRLPSLDRRQFPYAKRASYIHVTTAQLKCEPKMAQNVLFSQENENLDTGE